MLQNLIPRDSFTVQEAIDAYLYSTEHDWTGIVQIYQALVLAGILPDINLIWKIVRVALREQPDENKQFHYWADKLGPDNCEEVYEFIDKHATTMYNLARDASNATYMYNAADAASAAAFAIKHASLISTSRKRDSIAYAAFIASAVVDVGSAYHKADAIKSEVIEMVLTAIKKDNNEDS